MGGGGGGGRVFFKLFGACGGPQKMFLGPVNFTFFSPKSVFLGPGNSFLGPGPDPKNWHRTGFLRFFSMVPRAF